MPKTQTIPFKTGYLDRAIDDLPGVLKRARTALSGVKYDTLVGTGFSGALVVPALAMRVRKPFILVRKEGDGSHHSGRLIGNLGQRWIFVDDFVSSGATRTRVMEAVSSLAAAEGHTTEYLGDYCYSTYDGDAEEYGTFVRRFACPGCADVSSDTYCYNCGTNKIAQEA